jgi:hypothetical protein
MSEELRAAIERLRVAVNAQIPWEHPCYERTDGRSPKSKYDYDAFKVIEAYLAEHPANVVQSQRSLTDQIVELINLANRFGLYDAADWLSARDNGTGR